MAQCPAPKGGCCLYAENAFDSSLRVTFVQDWPLSRPPPIPLRGTSPYSGGRIKSPYAIPLSHMAQSTAPIVPPPHHHFDRNEVEWRNLISPVAQATLWQEISPLGVSIAPVTFIPITACSSARNDGVPGSLPSFQKVTIDTSAPALSSFRP